MKSSRANSQLNLPPTEVRQSQLAGAALRNSQQGDGPLRKSQQEPAALRNAQHADELSADLLNAAFEAAGLESKDIAHLCGVSVSLVEKWRSRDQRGSPSLMHMLLLPTTFHIALFRVMNRRHGYSRAAMASLLDAASALAVVID